MRWYVRAGRHQHHQNAYSEHATELQATQAAVDFFREGYPDVEVGTLEGDGRRTVTLDTNQIKNIAMVGLA
jgi:hypothetical protein